MTIYPNPKEPGGTRTGVGLAWGFREDHGGYGDYGLLVMNTVYMGKHRDWNLCGGPIDAPESVPVGCCRNAPDDCVAITWFEASKRRWDPPPEIEVEVQMTVLVTRTIKVPVGASDQDLCDAADKAMGPFWDLFDREGTLPSGVVVEWRGLDIVGPDDEELFSIG